MLGVKSDKSQSRPQSLRYSCPAERDKSDKLEYETITLRMPRKVDPLRGGDQKEHGLWGRE